MKKYLSLLFFSVITTYHFTQGQISIKISPGLVYSRVHTDPDKGQFGSNGIAFRGKLGASYDWLIQENYFLSIGGFFVAKQLSLKHETEEIEERHEVQCIQMPVLLKLYTSEIMLDWCAYVELGITGAVKINERVANLKGTNPFINQLRTWEIGGVFGCGIECRYSLFTSFFVGISYQPAFSSIIREYPAIDNNLKLFGYGDLITIDLGIKF
eukprot:gene745-923_t